MNRSAKQHLDKAAGYVAKGEEFYRKAAEEIMAAQEADPTLGNREIGEWFGRSHTWVQDIVRWRTTGKSTRGREDAPTPYAEQSGAVAKRHAKSVLRQAPPEEIAELVADLEPDKQRKITQALDTAAAKRQHEREQAAKAKEREHLGDETVDDLEFAEALQTTEYLLIKARGNIGGFVRQAGELGVENTPEAWRESCLRWVNDLKGHLGMAEALLAGDNIDWSAFEDMLDKEAS